MKKHTIQSREEPEGRPCHDVVQVSHHDHLHKRLHLLAVDILHVLPLFRLFKFVTTTTSTDVYIFSLLISYISYLCFGRDVEIAASFIEFALEHPRRGWPTPGEPACSLQQVVREPLSEEQKAHLMMESGYKNTEGEEHQREATPRIITEHRHAGAHAVIG